MPTLEFWLTLMSIVFTITTAILLLLPSQYDETKNETKKSKEETGPRVQVLVLGDLGRSPRMQYHALSIARHGGHVDLIGYMGSDPHPDILSQPLISMFIIPSPPSFLQTNNKALFLIYGPLKVLFQLWSLWILLGYRTKPAKWMLIQNPPSIPTLAIAQVICFIRNTQLIIDWHNFGHSILALKLGHKHPLVHVSEWYERTFSKSATAHFTVTDAMARVLKQDYHITTPIFPLHDRPASHFQPMNSSERFAFLGRLPETAFIVDEIKTGKTKLVVSSTSWTPDEDFSLLLDALVSYSELATTSHPHLPGILAIITGKGPQKEHYLSRIAALDEQGKLEMAAIKTAWLSMADYANLLGAADLGVSLHKSSSGVDLPMKVVDMFGAGLPVVGWAKFEAWPELVKENVNGRGFETAEELRRVLVGLFGGDGTELRKLRNGAVREGKRRWDDEWDPVAGKLLSVCK